MVSLLAALSIVLTACGGAAGPAAASAEPEKTDIVMGFVPSRDVNQVQASADSTAQYLLMATGYKVVSKALTSYAAVADGMTSKLIDICWGGPFDYVTTHNQNGAYPITASVRRGVKGYKAFVVVKSDSPIQSLKDLKGKSFAFGDTLSASSNLYPKFGIQKEGLNPDTIPKDTKDTNPDTSATRGAGGRGWWPARAAPQGRGLRRLATGPRGRCDPLRG